MIEKMFNALIAAFWGNGAIGYLFGDRMLPLKARLFIWSRASKTVRNLLKKTFDANPPRIRITRGAWDNICRYAIGKVGRDGFEENELDERDWIKMRNALKVGEELGLFVYVDGTRDDARCVNKVDTYEAL